MTGIPIESVRESSTNPRRSFDATALQELTESIRKVGVLQAILVRPNGPGYELVCGHRRLRAAKAAGLEEIPATVRELTDVEVLEAQITENLQRSDLHPLEEAEGYRQLHEIHHHSVEDLAAKVGKSRAYIYARLKLCALPKGAKKAFLEEKLSASIALLIARIPDADLAEKATKEVLTGRYRDSEPMSYREAEQWIHENYMLDLKAAPFPTGDSALVPKAGACGNCPKRTGNQQDLFGDVRSADVCTDPVCYRRKVEAHGDKRLVDGEAKGLPVLGKNDAKAIFDGATRHDGSPAIKYNSPFVAGDATNYEFGGGSIKALKKHLPPATLARDPHSGQVVELYRKDDVKKAAIAAGKLSASGKSKLTPREKEIGAAQRREQLAAAAGRRAVLEALVDAAERETNTADLWKALAHAAVARAWHDSLKDIVARRGLEVPKGKRPADVANDAIAKAKPMQARGWLVEVLAAPGLSKGFFSAAEKTRAMEVFDAFGVDRAAIEKRARAEIAKPGKGKTRAKPAEKPKSKKASRKAS